ncbi:hypothetical protein EDD22DRAFT_1050615 [Suillus occidentalis]|nr:hypothetical protein EDD22DRAFT_1050615 [Suillus occidentalis]
MDRMATDDHEEGPIHNGVVQRDKLFACIVKNGFQQRVSVPPARVLVDLARPIILRWDVNFKITGHDNGRVEPQCNEVQSQPPVDSPPEEKKSLKTIQVMQPSRDDLDLPKVDPFTLDELKQFGSSDNLKPIYVSIKAYMLSILNLGTMLRRASSDKQTFLILEQRLAKWELVDGLCHIKIQNVKVRHYETRTSNEQANSTAE